MKKHFLVTILIFIVVFSTAQNNLVPNYSFEIYVTCPYTTGQISYAIPWFQPLILGSTSEYYDTCSNYMNIMSYQQPRTGGGMAGIALYNSGSWREYIEVKLLNHLTPGKKYCLKFYVNLLGTSTFAIDAIGTCFSVDSLLRYAPFADSMLIPRIPQIENPIGNIISDTTNWVEISGNFIADSNYNFITIGNFYDDLHINYINVGGTMGTAYYLIDDVSVYLCDDTIPQINNNNIFIPNIFSPNNDGNNDGLYVRGENINELTFSVYNRWGEKVFETQNKDEGWNGNFKGKPCQPGVYYYMAEVTFTSGEKVMKKGNVTLVR